MKNKKKVVAITGTRSDFGPMCPIYRKIMADPSFEFGLIVTGMHLLPEYGMSIREIEREEFPIIRKISMLLGEDTNSAMAKGIGLVIYGVTDVLEELRPDIVLLQGDRGEMLAAAIAAAHLNIPVIHMSGGDFSGSIDDSIRNAITKFAHLHLVTCAESENQVRALGENSSRIFVVGEPTLDVINSYTPLAPKTLEEIFRIDLTHPLILAIQHTVTSESQESAAQMRETMEAIVEIGEQTIVTYPNSDAGGQAMIKIIEEYRNNPKITISKNLPHEVFLSLMNHASVMVGNSSSGIIEAPSFRLPVVNIGTRQIRRTRTSNVMDVGYDRHEIVTAIRTALSDTSFKRICESCRNPYGDGHTAEKVIGILKKVDRSPELLTKWMPLAPFSG